VKQIHPWTCSCLLLGVRRTFRSCICGNGQLILQQIYLLSEKRSGAQRPVHCRPRSRRLQRADPKWWTRLRNNGSTRLLDLLTSAQPCAVDRRNHSREIGSEFWRNPYRNCYGWTDYTNLLSALQASDEFLFIGMEGGKDCAGYTR
jgi:hypothetical protein